jgi:hypothetical protein
MKSSKLRRRENIIEKEGRQPYDANVPRVVIESLYSNVKPREPPENYISKQKYINSNDGKINQEILDIYLQKLQEKGFVAVSPEDVYTIRIGDRIAFIRNDNKWRSGGFLVDVKNSNTAYGEHNNNDEKSEYKPYVLFKAFNNAIFSLQVSDVYQFWVKRPAEKKIQDTISIFKIPTIETQFPVYLLNDNEDLVIIYYARDNYSRNRFMSTRKFQCAQEYGWKFEDGTQGENFEEEGQVVLDDAQVSEDEDETQSRDETQSSEEVESEEDYVRKGIGKVTLNDEEEEDDEESDTKWNVEDE